MIFLGSCSGNFYALDKFTGTPVWLYDIKKDGDQANFHGDPVLVHDLVVIGTDGPGTGSIYAFEKETGKVRWRFEAPCKDTMCGVPTDLVHGRSKIYGVSFEDELWCLDAATGQPVWSFESGFDAASDTEHSWTNTPAFADGRVFFSGLDGILYALDGETGEMIWHKNLGSPLVASALVGEQSVYTASADGWFYRLHFESGDILGRGKAGPTISRKPIFTGKEVLLFHNWLQEGGTLVCLEPTLDQKPRWRAQASESAKWSVPRPYLWKDRVLVGNHLGRLFAYKRTDGTLQWTHHLDGEIKGIGISEGILYVGTFQGVLYALVPE